MFLLGIMIGGVAGVLLMALVIGGNRWKKIYLKLYQIMAQLIS